MHTVLAIYYYHPWLAEIPGPNRHKSEHRICRPRSQANEVGNRMGKTPLLSWLGAPFELDFVSFTVNQLYLAAIKFGVLGKVDLSGALSFGVLKYPWKSVFLFWVINLFTYAYIHDRNGTLVLCTYMYNFMGYSFLYPMWFQRYTILKVGYQWCWCAIPIPELELEWDFDIFQCLWNWNRNWIEVQNHQKELNWNWIEG